MTNSPSNPDGALAARTRELEAVRAVTVEITQELDLPTLLALINRHAAELVGATASIIRLWDERAEVLIPVAWHGLGDWIRTEVRRLGESVSGTVAARREGLIVSDYQASPYAMPAMLAQTTITAALAEPLLYRGRLLGVLVVDRFAGAPPFTEADAALLRLFAAQAAIAIENARLHETTAHHAAQLTNLTDLTQMVSAVLEPAALAEQILRAAQALIPGAVGRLWEAGEDALRLVAGIGLQDPAGGDRYRFLRGEGMAGQAIATRQPVICADVAGDPRFASKAWARAEGLASCIVLPLIHRDQALGVLVLYTRSPHVFPPDEVRLLSAFAAQAAIAMANARLYTTTQEELAARKRAEGALRESETQLRATLESAADGILAVGNKGEVLQASRRFAELWRIPQSVIERGDDRALLDIALDQITDPDAFLKKVQALYGSDAVGMDTLVFKDGRVFERYSSPIIMNGARIGRVWSFRDITERKRAEVALRDRTAQLEAVQTVTAEITRELDLDRLLTLLTQRVTRLLCVPTASIRLWDETSGLLIPLGWTSEVSPEIARLPFRLGEGVAGAAAQRRTGLLVNDFRTSPYATPALLAGAHTAVLAEPLLYHDRLVGVLSVDNGTTGRPFTPDDQALLHLFADQAAIAIENARLHTATVRRGEELDALLRSTRAVMTGLNLQQTLEAIASEAARIARCEYIKLLLVDREAQFLRIGVVRGLRAPEGFPLPIGTGLSGTVAQTGQPLYIADTQNDPRSILADFDRSIGLRTYLGLPITIRGEVLGVLTFNTPEPYEYTPEEITYFTAFADQAAIALENARLFTEATQSLQNLQKAQAALVQTEKLRALGQMVGGIAHDLNNKLMVILGQSELLRLTAAHPALEQALAPLEAAATASIAVVRQILDFGRQHADAPHTPIALAAVVQEALALTRAQWKDTAERQGSPITVHTALADLPPVLGQGAELREALVQLIGNAVEAMPTGGTLTIAGRVPAPGWVELTVTDTGVGIPMEIQPDLFDPFFTTKGVQRTGLGLAVVYGTLQRHGGTISVDSAPSQGTTFTLRLPAAAVAVQTTAPPAPAPARAGVTPRRLLLIDDEPKVRGTLASLLRAAGHSVTEAASGPAGLALLGTIPVDCVLTDLGMPEMTGWEVVKAVNASWPHLPVLLLTGWGGQEADVPPGHRVARVLSKPIRREPLLVVIAEVTEGR